MGKITKLPDGSTIERDSCLRVVSMDAKSAREFFGLGPEVRVVDGGPPGRPEKYKPGARLWLIYKSAEDMPS